jgi:hypothetical protein
MEFYELLTGIILVGFGAFSFGLSCGALGENKRAEDRVKFYQKILKNRARSFSPVGQ